jgi:hypothetical protein
MVEKYYAAHIKRDLGAAVNGMRPKKAQKPAKRTAASAAPGD